jgi:hypothetical protein
MSNVRQKDRAIRLTRRLTIATLVSVCLFFGRAEIRDSALFKFIGSQPAAAQFFRPQDAWRQVYQRLPDFPRENEYVSKETGKVNSDDTLVSRLIRYHLYVKSRPANNRFDWKLTMADYLGAHEFLVESQYPSGNTLQENPMESDRTVIQKLTRSQRDALVDVLVSIFNTNRAQTPTQTPRASPSPSPLAPPPTTSNSPAKPSLPQPGDAQLLMP